MFEDRRNTGRRKREGENKQGQETTTTNPTHKRISKKGNGRKTLKTLENTIMSIIREKHVHEHGHQKTQKHQKMRTTSNMHWQKRFFKFLFLYMSPPHPPDQPKLACLLQAALEIGGRHIRSGALGYKKKKYIYIM